jgi:hypothetical protein
MQQSWEPFFGIRCGVRFMTADIVNLAKARKARERANREREAHQNRLKFGQSKAERTLLEAQERKSRAELDRARRQGERPADGNIDDPEPGNGS